MSRAQGSAGVTMFRMNGSFLAPAPTVGALGENDTSAIRGGRMSRAQE